jgi:hypothetical protein
MRNGVERMIPQANMEFIQPYAKNKIDAAAPCTLVNQR